MALSPAPCFKDQFPGGGLWPSGNYGIIKLHILLAAARISMPPLGVARIVEKGMGVLKISILLGLILFAFVPEFFIRFRVLEIKHHPVFPQPVTVIELNNRIEWRGVGYQPAFYKYLEYIMAEEQLATTNQFRTEYHGAYDDPIPSVLASRPAWDDTEDNFRVWHISADGELVNSSTTVHWLYYNPVSGAVEAQPWEDTASSQLNTIPDPERATQYSISDGNTFLHPPPSSISSISQKIRTSDRHLGMTSSTEAETCPLWQIPNAVRLGGCPKYSHGPQDGQLPSMSNGHNDWVLSNSACCQLNLQSAEESGNHDSPGSRLKLKKMI